MLKFTNIIISSLQVPTDGKEAEYSDSLVNGFKVRVSAKGAKIFYLVYKIQGRRRKYRIGNYKDIKVPAARKIAADLRSDTIAGKDPQAKKIAQRKKMRKRKAMS